MQFMVQASPDTGDWIAASGRRRARTGESRRVSSVGGGSEARKGGCERVFELG